MEPVHSMVASQRLARVIYWHVNKQTYLNFFQMCKWHDFCFYQFISIINKLDVFIYFVLEAHLWITRVHPTLLVDSCSSISSLLFSALWIVFWGHFVLLLLTIASSVLRFTSSDYLFGILDLRLSRFTLVTNPVISHEWEKDQIVITTKLNTVRLIRT
jgi:hypothetical protein